MRAAIYFLPDPTSNLWRKASTLLGYDSISGQSLEPIALAGMLPAAVAAITEEPRRYGFHATLKAPFRLAPGRSLEKLIFAVETFVNRRRRPDPMKLKVDLIKGFAALTPCGPSADVVDLARDCVAELDAFRAPMSGDERTRRLAAPLTQTQIELMDRWGYPYVFDEFRFHMTLTNVLPAPLQRPALDALQDYFAPDELLAPVNAISICVQPSANDRFHQVARIAFR